METGVNEYPYYLLSDEERTKPYFKYIRISEIPEIERNDFIVWLRGQSYPVIPGEKEHNTAHAVDYTRFRKNFYMNRKEYDVKDTGQRPPAAST